MNEQEYSIFIDTYINPIRDHLTESDEQFFQNIASKISNGQDLRPAELRAIDSYIEAFKTLTVSI